MWKASKGFKLRLKFEVEPLGKRKEQCKNYLSQKKSLRHKNAPVSWRRSRRRVGQGFGGSLPGCIDLGQVV